MDWTKNKRNRKILCKQCEDGKVNGSVKDRKETIIEKGHGMGK